MDKPFQVTTFSSLDFPNLTATFDPFGDFLLLLILLSLATMSTLQGLKVLGLRASVYRRAIGRWMGRAAADANKRLLETRVQPYGPESGSSNSTENSSKEGPKESMSFREFVEPGAAEPSQSKNAEIDQTNALLLKLSDEKAEEKLKAFWNGLKSETLLERLRDLAMPSSSSASLYRMPLEQLIGQFNAAVQPIIDTPSRRDWPLLFSLSHGAGVAMFLISYGPAVCRREDIVRMVLGDDAPDPKPGTENTSIEAARIYEETTESLVAEAQNQINAQVQRSLDALQVHVSARWRLIRTFLCGSLAIAFSFGFAALFEYDLLHTGGGFDGTDPSSLLEIRNLVLWFVAGVIAAVLAPVMRDIAAGIHRLARPEE